MCGIVGIYLKKKNLHQKLGNYLSGMLDNMSSRGPDSAGFAIYNKNNSSRVYKYSVCFPSDFDIRKLLGNLPKDESEKSGSNGLSKSLESSILGKINKN